MQSVTENHRLPRLRSSGWLTCARRSESSTGVLSVRSRNRFIAACALMMLVSGCSTPRQPAAIPTQQTLLTTCPETLPPVTDGTGGTLVRTMTEWASQYHECATRHNGLVQAIEGARDE